MGKSENDFIGESLNDILMMDSHISFCEALMEKYKLSTEEENSIKDMISEINEKRGDSRFNISVIGEFSTGKSTFINAFIRENLLSANSLQGTTVASTIIERGNKNRITVSYKTGCQKTVYADTDEKIRAAVDEYTSATQNGQNIERVRIELKSNKFSDDFRIIDTPGTNVEQLWHEETTINTINKYSDTSIVLLNADKILPESFSKFIHNHLEEVLPQCIFVVTKIDRVHPKEREAILEYTRNRLRNDFDLSNPLVVPYASLFVLEDAGESEDKPDYRYDDRAELVAQSYRGEVQIYNYVIKQRSVIQAKKMIHLMDAMYTNVSGYIDNMKHTYQLDSERLEQAKKLDVGLFIAQQKNERQKEFQDNVEIKKQKILQLLSENIDSCKAQIMSAFEECNTMDKLKAFTDTKYGELCAQKAKECMTPPGNWSYSIKSCFNNSMSTLKKEFKRIYSKDSLMLDVIEGIENGDTAERMTDSLSGSTLNTVQSTLSKENWTYAGGAAAGAAVGTAILPGIGTVIGGLAGLIFGGMFSPNVSNVKDKIRPDIKSSLQTYFAGVENVMSENIDKYISDLKLQIIKEADKYLETYNQIISAEIKQQSKRKAELDAMVAEINDDISNIGERRGRLNRIREKINNMA